ncbi:MAG: hypothetical protein AAF962_09045 [Actinomycetota bacterium]
MVDVVRRFASRFAHLLVGTLAFTRHGALAAARSNQTRRVLSPVRKTVLVLIGTTLIGLGVSLFIHARLGLPPYDVLVSAIATLTDLSHGRAALAVGVGFLLLAAALGRRPNGYVLLFLVATGANVDLWTELLMDPPQLAVRILFVVFGVGAIAAGLAVIAHSSSTGGPFELVAMAAADRNLSPSTARSILEAVVIVGGIALGGDLGIATVVFAVFIGPAIASASQALDDRRDGRQHRLARTAAGADG